MSVDVRYRFYALRIFSFNWEEAFRFYQDTIGLTPTYVDPDLGWAQFDVGGVSLGLEWQDPDDPEARALVGRFVGTSILVDDIHHAYRELCARGVTFLGEPELQIWGGTLAHFKDPDGNVLTLLGATDETL